MTVFICVLAKHGHLTLGAGPEDDLGVRDGSALMPGVVTPGVASAFGRESDSYVD